MQDNVNMLRPLLELANIPEKLIQEIEAKPLHYREAFGETMQTILQNEVLNLLAFMDVKESIKEKAGL